MSLSVYLKDKPIEKECYHCGSMYMHTEYLYEDGITHNLVKMAEKADLYKACWCPEELGISIAKDLIPYLQKGLLELETKDCSEYNAKNGWGIQDDLIEFVSRYLRACNEYPEATICVCG